MERDFKGVWISKEVWLDERLNALDKVILTEIDSLDQGDRGCYASNKHMATFCQCSERKVSEAISKLIKYGYIYVQNFDGRQRELKSRLSNFASQPSKNCEAETKKMRQSNTKSNTKRNTDNNTNTIDDLNTIDNAGEEENESVSANELNIYSPELRDFFERFEIKNESDRKKIIQYLSNGMDLEVIKNGLSIPFQRNYMQYDFENDVLPIKEPVLYGMAILDKWYSFNVKTLDDMKRYNRLNKNRTEML